MWQPLIVLVPMILSYLYSVGLLINSFSTCPILTPREEQITLVNRVLRRMCGPKREELVGGWRRLHNEELHNLCTSQDIIMVIKWRRLRWAGHIALMGEMRNVYRILVGKPRHRWEDNIRIDLREIGWKGADWVHVTQDWDLWKVLVNTS